MMQDNDVKRPTEELEHDPVRKIDTTGDAEHEKKSTASEKLKTVTTTVEKSSAFP